MSAANDNPCLRLGIRHSTCNRCQTEKMPKNPLGFCYTTEIIFRNFELLEIKPKKIIGCVLSHANRDH